MPIFAKNILFTFFSALFQDFFVLFRSDGVGCLFRFGANFFFHFAVVFDLFEDELVFLVGDVRISDRFADDS